VSETTPLERDALAFLPHGKRMMEACGEMLPPGTDFGVYILVPANDGSGEDRVIALNTNRDVMAPAVAQWLLTVLPDERG
jgi:hypothetical protein